MPKLSQPSNLIWRTCQIVQSCKTGSWPRETVLKKYHGPCETYGAWSALLQAWVCYQPGSRCSPIPLSLVCFTCIYTSGCVSYFVPYKKQRSEPLIHIEWKLNTMTHWYRVDTATHTVCQYLRETLERCFPSERELKYFETWHHESHTVLFRVPHTKENSKSAKRWVRIFCFYLTKQYL